MARRFVQASTQYFANLNTLITASPFTMSCWFNPSEVTSTGILMAMGHQSSGGDYFGLFAAGATAGDPLIYQVRGSSSNTNAITTTGFLASLWQHAACAEASSSDHKAYLNGGGLGSSSTSKIPIGINDIAIGAIRLDIPINPFNGQISNAALWNVALSAAEIYALYRGFLPTMVNPTGLVSWWKLNGTTGQELSIQTPYAMINNNASMPANSPLLYQPRQQFLNIGKKFSSSFISRLALLGAG